MIDYMKQRFALDWAFFCDYWLIMLIIIGLVVIIVLLIELKVSK